MFPLHSGINGFCLNLPPLEIFDLILHQSNQRSYHHTYTFFGQTRHLVGNGLSPSRRHQGKGIFSGQYGKDNFFL